MFFINGINIVFLILIASKGTIPLYYAEGSDLHKSINAITFQ